PIRICPRVSKVSPNVRQQKSGVCTRLFAPNDLNVWSDDVSEIHLARIILPVPKAPKSLRQLGTIPHHRIYGHPSSSVKDATLHFFDKGSYRRILQLAISCNVELSSNPLPLGSGVRRHQRSGDLHSPTR